MILWYKKLNKDAAVPERKHEDKYDEAIGRGTIVISVISAVMALAYFAWKCMAEI